MVDAQVDFKLLQALLFCAEVVNIRVGEVIRLTEKTRMFVDDLLRQIVDCLNRPPDHAGIKDMVVVLAVVEANQTILCEHRNIICAGVDHAMNHRLVAALKLPVDQQQIRKHLAVKEYDRRFKNRHRREFLRLKVHLRHDLQARICLIRAGCSKAKDAVAHVIYVIMEVAVVSILQNLVDEVDGRFSIGMNLLVEIAHDQNSQRILALDVIDVYHFFSLHW